MCGGNIFKALEPALGAIIGSAILPGIGTGLGFSAGGLATAGGALGGLGGGLLSGDKGLGLGLDALGGGIAPNSSDIFKSVGGGLSDLYSGSALENGVNSISDGLSNFSDSTGLSQLFGGTAAPSSDLTSAYNGINNAAPAGLDTVTAASTPSSNLSGYLPSGSLSSAGGGATGGGFDLGGAGESFGLGDTGSLSSSNFGTGIGTGSGTDSLSNLFNPSSNVGTFNYDSLGNAAGASSLSAPEQFASALNPSTGASAVGNSGLSGLFGGTSGSNPLISNLLRLGAAGLSNTNGKGFDAQANAGNQISADFQPFLNAGTSAQNTLSDLYGLNGAGAQTGAQTNWQNTPGYQFALDQGTKAVNADAAKKGQLVSGNNQQAIQQYGTGLANQTYNNYLTNLQQQAQQGISAAGGVATGQAGVGNAQAGKSGAAANKQNLLLGLSTLFG